MNGLLEIASHGRVRRIALNRPEKRNAINRELCAALVSVLESAADDPSVGCILLTGNGSAFCAGMDLNEAAAGDSDNLAEVHDRLFTIGSRVTKPIVSAVHGSALGGGTGLVANCHIVVAAESATFGLTEIRLGLWPFLIYRACDAAMGPRRTLELALTGRTFGAQDACNYGLAHEVGPFERALEIATRVAAWSSTAICGGMRYVHESMEMDWTTAGLAARNLRRQAMASADFREGLRAFLEKRGQR